MKYFTLPALILSLSCGSMPAHEPGQPHPTASDYSPPDKPVIIGQGKFRYQLVPAWATENTSRYPLGHCHAMAEDSRGRILLLNSKFKVIANLGGDPPEYNKQGKLKAMQHSSHLFYHPHGLCFDHKGNLYVAQFASNASWPLKFVRIGALSPPNDER